MKICKKCVLDENIPEIEFDSEGICNYCKLHDALSEAFPMGKEGEKILKDMFEKIKAQGEGKKYDSIIGVSGGVDSIYLLHLAKKYNLHPLAVHVDNGWDSELSLDNINNCVKKLNVDLVTYKIDPKEMKDVLKSFIKASFAWADGPTDLALVSVLYLIAKKNKIKSILIGNNFRTEGRQPTEWTHIDVRTINAVHKKYGELESLKAFPKQSLWDLFIYGFVYKIKLYKPLYFIDYDKAKAKKILKKLYSWKDYGGHHHESIFTRFVIGYWLPHKFGIEKRKITFSAQIRSGYKNRDKALRELKELPYKKEQMEKDKRDITKKLGFTKKEFEDILESSEMTTYKDFPSYKRMYNIVGKYMKYLYNLLGVKPMLSFELPKQDKTKNIE